MLHASLQQSRQQLGSQAAASAAAVPTEPSAAGAPSALGRAADAGPLLAASSAEERRALKLPTVALEVPELALEPVCRKRRLEAPVAQVSPFFLLQPYAAHKPAFVGRSLWCLDCFEMPGSAHRSWRHGRCGGPKPPTTMPPALRDGILRQSAVCPKLQASTRGRWAVLAGALGLH